MITLGIKFVKDNKVKYSFSSDTGVFQTDESLDDFELNPEELLDILQNYKRWKYKANSWDELDKKIARCYPELNEDDEENVDESCYDSDLADIGEIAATAFGYLH